MHPEHRNTLALIDAEILSHQAWEGDQYILRLRAPDTAARALPGHFAHIQVHPLQPMRRPISIMRTDSVQGTVDFLYKAVGEGTRLLARRQPGEILSIIAPIGNSFVPTPGRTRPLLIGGGVGMPPMIFLASHLKEDPGQQPFVILGSEVPFPFNTRPSKIMVPGLPDGVIATMPLLDDWGVASRLASGNDYAGVFQGYVTELAEQWLQSLDDSQRAEVEIFSCGPEPMLEAVAKLAARHALPAQLSLEEYMACGVGGCAGCVVEVKTDTGVAMKRVCVDGPVFPAAAVFSP